MAKIIPCVSAELLMEADRKIAEDHEAGLEPDPTVSIVSVLHDKCEPDEMIAIGHRLHALAYLIRDGDSGGWTTEVDGQTYTLVHGALIRAAATAKLYEAKTIGELRFEPKDILEIALRETDTEGSA